jgi:hypothetical protein
MVKKRRGQSAAFMRSINPHLRRGKSKIKSRTTTMRRRKSKSGRRSHKSYGSKQSLLKTLMYAVGYGVVRNPIANFTTPMVDKVISTPYNDHIGNGAVALLAYKFGSGAIREAGKVALMVEAASASTGLINIGGTTSSGLSGYTFN